MIGPMFAVRMYAIADKYDVAGARTEAARLAKLLMDDLDERIWVGVAEVRSEDMIALVRLVAESTSDDTLWDVVLPKVEAH